MLDDLVQYCLTEIAYEGELGCTVSRLKELVTDFCNSLHANQKVDDKFVAYVWSIMAAHPSIQIGTVPKDTPAVWIAPPVLKKDTVAPPVELTSLSNESSLAMLELEKEHGDQLRVAANKATTFYAITGSHERPAKLSPTVYTILQLVCRTRTLGLATKDLGALTGYDPRSIHYQITQLLDLGLLIKYVKGTSQNWVIHKRWADSIRLWTGETPVHREEESLNIIQVASLQLPDDPTIFVPASEVTNLPLLQSRLIRLLLDSPNHTRPFSNLILACGYANPTKNDRRFFTSRVHDMISDGTLQKFKLNDRGGDRIALSEKFLAERGQSREKAMDGTLAPVLDSILEDADNGDVYGRGAYPLAFNIPMQRQMIDIIHAHPEGLTIKEISELMGHLDRRTIEHVMTRAAGRIPPKPTSYLQVCLVMETAGKQRRQRFYTWEHYRALLRSQKLNDDRFDYLNDDHRDEFMEIKREHFYTNEQELVAHEKAVSDGKKPSLQRDSVVKKKQPGKNPIVNGVPKRGRPRKEYPPEEEPRRRKRKSSVLEGGKSGEEKSKKPRKRKADEMEGDAGNSAISPAKGRPSKKRKASHGNLPAPDAAPTSLASMPNAGPIPVANDVTPSQPPAAAQGITPVAISTTVPEAPALAFVPAAPSTVAPAGPSRKRGRPPKFQAPNETPTPKQPRKSKKATTEPVPETSLERDDTAVSAVPPAPKVPAWDEGQAIPQTTAGEQNVEARHAAVVTQAPISNQALASVHRGRGKKARVGITGPAVKTIMRRVQKNSSEINTLSARASLTSTPSFPVVQSFPVQDGQPIDPQSSHSQPLADGEPTILSEVVQGANDVSTSEVAAHTNTDETSMVNKLDRIANRRSFAMSKNITNISDIRRMNELLSLMRARGGVITVNYELSFLWAEHIKTLQGEGVVTSAPADARADKKTVSKIVGMLEESGQIKVIKTLSPDLQRRVSLKQPVTIAYLPDVSPEDVHQYILSIQNAVKALTVAPPHDAINDAAILPNPPSVRKSPRKKRSLSPQDRQNPLPLHDPESYGARRPFLEDPLTLRQMAGYLLGKARRAQELHLFTLNHILSPNPSDHVISSEERIISIEYWFTDFPLGSFCATVPLRRYIPYIEGAQTDPDLLSQPLITLDSEVYNCLEVRSHKSRERLLELLETLINVKFVTPLVETDSENAEIVVEPRATHPTMFNTFIPSILKAGKLPKYWIFNRIAPQYLYALAGDEDPPLQRDAPLDTMDEAISFWNFLKLQSDLQAVQSLADLASRETRSVTGEYSCSRGVVATLTSLRGWRSKYVLSQVQVVYLRSIVDWKTGHTPLNDDTPSRLLEACYLTCAPETVVCEYLAYLHDRALAHIATQQRRRRENGARRKISQEAEMRVALANKTARHLQTLERQWLDLLKETYPEPLTDKQMITLLPLRGRFVTNIAPFDKEKLIRLIKASLASDRTDTADETTHASSELPAPNLDEVFARTAPSTSSVSLPNSGRPILPPIVEHQDDQDVAALVASMGHLTSPTTTKSNVKFRKQKETPVAEVAVRRKRFNWRPEYDELLLDAVVVIRARSRHRKRTMEWAPVTPVFPTIHHNSCRLRYNHLLETAGSSLYMERLTDTWYHLWQAHLGSDYLPDQDPNALGGCDLIKHIEFLRKYIDKHAIRTGVALVKNSSKTRAPLPASGKDLNGLFSIVEGSLTENQEWDRCWKEDGIEPRAKALHMQAFVDSAPITSIQEPSSGLFVASSAIHAIIATDAKSYDEEKAAHVLSAFGNETVRHAAGQLQRRGIITKTGWKPHPGRTYKLTDHLHEAIQGDIASTTYSDAHEFAVEADFDSSWMEWPMDVGDGDMAVFLQRFSDHKLDFKFGEGLGAKLFDECGYIGKSIGAQYPSMAKYHRADMKTDDDMLETPLKVRFLTETAEGPISSPSVSSTSQHITREIVDVADVDIDTEAQGQRHGFNGHGEKAACVLSKQPGELIDCSQCIQDSLRNVLSQLQRENHAHDADLLDSLYKKVNLAGPTGLVAEVVNELLMDRRIIAHKLWTGPVPVLFWTGYSRSRLVASTHLQHYTVKAFPVSQKGKERDDGALFVTIFPRCWLDLRGDIINDTWVGLLRSILAIVLVQGRVPQVEFVRQLSNIYDRLEVLDGLKYLQGIHQLRRLYQSEEGDPQMPSWGVGEETVEEAQNTAWEVAETIEWSEYV